MYISATLGDTIAKHLVTPHQHIVHNVTEHLEM